MVGRVCLVMGVCGSGKTSVAQEAAKACAAVCIDGDDYHPQANKDKMQSGQPLTDEDRWPWLTSIADAAVKLAETFSIVFIACSALKKSYRVFLEEKAGIVRIYWLHGPADVLLERLSNRKGHFMNPTLLQSQLDTLEEPVEENSLLLDIRESVDKLVSIVVEDVSSIEAKSHL